MRLLGFLLCSVLCLTLYACETPTQAGVLTESEIAARRKASDIVAWNMAFAKVMKDRGSATAPAKKPTLPGDPEFLRMIQGFGDNIEASLSDMFRPASPREKSSPPKPEPEPELAQAPKPIPPAPRGWTVPRLRQYLAAYKRNPNRKPAYVVGMTYRQHLVGAAEHGNHAWPAALVDSLTQEEQQLLHSADHYSYVTTTEELLPPDGPAGAMKPLNKNATPDVVSSPPPKPVTSTSSIRIGPVMSSGGCPGGVCPNPRQQSFRTFGGGRRGRR